MTPALPRAGKATHSSLLGLVLVLHAVTLALVLSPKTAAPSVAEPTLMVDLLPVQETARPPQAKSVPVARTQSTKLPAHPVAATRLSPAAVETSSSPLSAATTPAPVPAPSTPPPALAASGPSPAEPVSQARFDVDTLHNPAPPYPPLSRRMQEEGKVILRVAVNPLGLPDSVEVRTSSGSPRLDESAQKTVRNWKFIPARRGEVAIASSVLVPIIFKLES